MKRVLALALSVGAAALPWPAFAGRGQPVLRSAMLRNGHVVVVLTVGEFEPGSLQVATRPQRGPSGRFLPAYVVLSETIPARPDPVTGLVRWETHRTLLRRTYYVHVSALDSAGASHWSLVRAVGVRSA
jgi:hypothetical protein